MEMLKWRGVLMSYKRDGRWTIAYFVAPFAVVGIRN
jgi:hypothetical protein